MSGKETNQQKPKKYYEITKPIEFYVVQYQMLRKGKAKEHECLASKFNLLNNIVSTALPIIKHYSTEGRQNFLNSYVYLHELKAEAKEMAKLASRKHKKRSSSKKRPSSSKKE